MTYIRPDNLTDSEYAQYLTYLSDGTDVIGDAVANIEEAYYYLENPDEMPEGMNAMDLLAFIIEVTGDIPDPDDVGDVFEDDEVLAMMLELQSENSDLSSAIDDLFTTIGFDEINQANILIQYFADEYGPDALTGNSSSTYSHLDLAEEMENLLAAAEDMGLPMMLLIWLQKILLPMDQQTSEIIQEKREELFEIRDEDVLDRLQGLDMSDEYATVEIKEIDIVLNDVNSLSKSLDEAQKMMYDQEANLFELWSSVQQSITRTQRSAIDALQ
jgi:hypothetical protein